LKDTVCYNLPKCIPHA